VIHSLHLEMSLRNENNSVAALLSLKDMYMFSILAGFKHGA